MKSTFYAAFLFLVFHAGLSDASDTKSSMTPQKIPLNTITNKKLPFSIAVAMSTLTPIASVRTKGGEEIKLYKISEKYGECDEGEVSMKADHCPRSSILISTMLDREGGSQFKLYKTPAHLNWLMPETQLAESFRDGKTDMPYQGTLLVCEKFLAPEGKVNWRFVEYQLRVTHFDRVELFRMPDLHRYTHCALPEAL